jgi:hypothetical protein
MYWLPPSRTKQSGNATGDRRHRAAGDQPIEPRRHVLAERLPCGCATEPAAGEADQVDQQRRSRRRRRAAGRRRSARTGDAPIRLAMQRLGW